MIQNYAEISHLSRTNKKKCFDGLRNQKADGVVVVVGVCVSFFTQ